MPVAGDAVQVVLSHRLSRPFQGDPFDTYRALGIGFDLGFDAGAGKVDVKDFGFGAPGGGKMRLGAKLDINTMSLDANLAFTEFHSESYVPPELRAMAGGKLQGRIDAHADLAHKSARLSRVDLKFSRPKANGLPREVKINGSALLAADRVKTDGLTVSVTGAFAPESLRRCWMPSSP